jgi:hypothetical protein
MSEIVDRPDAPEPLLLQIWPAVVIGLGLGLTTCWVFFLAQGLAKLIEMAI